MTTNTTTTMDLVGLGVTRVAAEITDSSAVSQFSTLMQALNTYVSSNSASVQNAISVVSTMQSLYQLALGQNSNALGQYLTIPMANILNVLAGQFLGSGIVISATTDNLLDPNNGSQFDPAGIGQAAFSGWLSRMNALAPAPNPPIPGQPANLTVFQTILVEATQATAMNRSLQSLIELEYISTGNDMLYDQMTKLQQAIEAGRGTLSILNELQDLRNGSLKAPAAKSNPVTSADNYNTIQTKADTAFKNPLVPDIIGPTPFDAFTQQNGIPFLANIKSNGRYILPEFAADINVQDPIATKLIGIYTQLRGLYDSLQRANYIPPVTNLQPYGYLYSPDELSPTWKSSLQGQVHLLMDTMTPYIPVFGQSDFIGREQNPPQQDIFFRVVDFNFGAGDLTSQDRVYPKTFINYGNGPVQYDMCMVKFVSSNISAGGGGFPDSAGVFLRVGTVFYIKSPPENQGDITGPDGNGIYYYKSSQLVDGAPLLIDFQRGVPRKGTAYGWLMDAQDNSDPTKQGNFQRALTTAVTGAENFNTSQNQNLQNYTFLFQQFYQSAAALLTSINQLIVKFAQNIGG